MELYISIYIASLTVNSVTHIFLQNNTNFENSCPIVSPWVLIPLANHPAIFSVLPGTEKYNKSPRQTKSPDNSNILCMFNNNIDSDFKTAYKHILIPSYSSDSQVTQVIHVI